MFIPPGSFGFLSSPIVYSVLKFNRVITTEIISQRNNVIIVLYRFMRAKSFQNTLAGEAKFEPLNVFETANVRDGSTDLVDRFFT